MSIRLLAVVCLAAFRLNASQALTLQPVAGFTENKGQYAPNVRFGTEAGDVYLTADSMVLAPDQMVMKFEARNPVSAPVPLDPLPLVVNTYTGSDPGKWVTGARVFGRVQYTDLWPSIDAVFSQDTFFTFRFVIRPGGDPASIRLSYTGARVGIGYYSQAQLILNLDWGRMGQNSLAYQERAGVRTAIAVRYTSQSDGFGMALDTYDRTSPVVIETTLPAGISILPTPQAVGPSGALYGADAGGTLVTGTLPPDTAVPSSNVCARDRNSACHDVLVIGYSTDGRMRYITRLQGTRDDTPSAIRVDSHDTIYVTGQTNSADFPATSGAVQPRYAGPEPAGYSIYDSLKGDVFFAKLDGATGKLLYSTYLGGPRPDSASGLQLDTAGNAYIGGPSSAGLPVTTGALRKTECATPSPYTGTPTPCRIGYVAKFDTVGRLSYLTYLPAGPETFAADPRGNIYFGGVAVPGDFAPTPGAYQTAPLGSRSAFVAKLDPAGSLVYATYYGGPDVAGMEGLAVDSAGNMWFNAPAANSIGARQYAHLVKLNAGASAVLYATPFLGGIPAVDAQDRVLVLTQAYTSQIVRTPKGLVNSVCAGGDATVTLLDRDGTVLANRPFTNRYIIALQPDARIFSVDRTSSAFGHLLDTVEPAAGPEAACTLNAASLAAPNQLAPGEIFTVVGVDLGPKGGAVFRLDSQGRVPPTVGGVRVLIDGAPVPVLYSDDGQVNAIAPYSFAGKVLSVEIERQGVRTPALAVGAVTTQNGLFTLDGSGGGRVLAFNQDGSLNSPGNPANLGSIVTIFATGTGATSPPSVEGTVATSIEPRPAFQTPILMGGAAGGIPTEILYYGLSPGSLTGVTQINLRLPASVPAESAWTLDAWPIQFSGPFTQFVTISIRR